MLVVLWSPQPLAGSGPWEVLATRECRQKGVLS